LRNYRHSGQKDTFQARLLHALAKTSTAFDDPNLVAHAGLVPLMALADRARLAELAADMRGIRAPSALGSFLRAFTCGNVSQPQKANRDFLAGMYETVPRLPGAETLAFADIDATRNRVHGYQKHARYGHAEIAGKSVLSRMRRYRCRRPSPTA
jgi:hypothetical protein